MSKAIFTRLDGSENKKANIGYRSGGVVKNDFDACYPWNAIEEVNDGNGNKWIRIPVFYTWYEVKNGVVVGRKISEYKINDDWFLNPIFIKNGQVLPYVEISKYLMSYVDGKAWTKSGHTPIKNIKPSVAREYANALSTEEHDVYLFDIWALQLLQDLFAVEFGTTKCQTIMKGFIYSYYSAQGLAANGTTDSIPYVTGVSTSNAASNGSACMKYRGIENLWGNGSLFVDGVRGTFNSVKINKNPKTYNTAEEYIQTDIQFASDGVVHQLQYDVDNSLVFPVHFNEKGLYKNNLYKGVFQDREYDCYCGANSENIGLWTYDITTPVNVNINYGVYKMIRR